MTDEGCGNLARGIVLMAIEDWRKLIKAKAYRNERPRFENNKYGLVTFGELRNFLGSDWCDHLLDSCEGDVSGKYILRMLEDELEDAMVKDQVRYAHAKRKRANAERGNAERKYLCLEDGVVCDTVEQAANHSGVTQRTLRRALDDAAKSANGKHWIRIKKS
jgi:hypothetical protein